MEHRNRRGSCIQVLKGVQEQQAQQECQSKAEAATTAATWLQASETQQVTTVS